MIGLVLAKLLQLPALALVGLAFTVGHRCGIGLAQFRLVFALLTTGFGFLIKLLGDTGRATGFAQGQDHHLKLLEATPDLQLGTYPQRVAGLDPLAIEVDLAAGHRLLGQAAGLEKARGP